MSSDVIDAQILDRDSSVHLSILRLDVDALVAALVVGGFCEEQIGDRPVV
jgi:hypothetical protein